jgi:hypothetical protein
MKKNIKEKKQSSLVRRGEGPEDALWRNVILQAITDATLQLPSYQSVFRERMELIRGQARRWVKAQREDFQLVCQLAGLEASRVHTFAMAQIRKAIEEEQERTANFLKGSMPGVVAEIPEGQRDRRTQAAQKIANIEFSQKEALPPCP